MSKHTAADAAGSGISQRRFLKLLGGTPFVMCAGAAPPRLIDWARTRQTMDGFGACAAFHVANNIRLIPPDMRTELLDLLFSPSRGAGLSYVRNIVGDGGDIGGGKTWGTPRNGSTPTIEPRESEWDWAGDEEQLWFMSEAVQRGCNRHFSTVWSPPAWMKDNASVIGGGRLRDDKYRAFAEYLSAYVRGYREHHGIVIDAISPANEPNLTTKYSSCRWTGAEFLRLVRDHIAPVFERDAVTAKFVLGESWYWSDELVRDALADPAARARIDVVASHAYTKSNAGFEPFERRTGVFAAVRAAGKPLWQTEVMCADANDPSINDALYWARLIHAHIVDNGASAWFYWTAATFRSSRSGLIEYDDTRKALIVPKRLFALGNFSRFVRPGFVCVACEPRPARDVLLAAFADPNSSRKVAVLINYGASEGIVRVPAGAAQVAVYRTSATENLAAVGNLRAEAGVISVRLPPSSITSLVA